MEQKIITNALTFDNITVIDFDKIISELSQHQFEERTTQHPVDISRDSVYINKLISLVLYLKKMLEGKDENFISNFVDFQLLERVLSRFNDKVLTSDDIKTMKKFILHGHSIILQCVKNP